MIRIGWYLLKRFNRLVARLIGATGWCYMGYQFSRGGLPEEEDEGGVWAAIPPEGRLESWWGAFMFKWRPLEEAEKTLSYCNQCGTEIVLYVDSDGKYFHPFFIGYCPECNVAVKYSDVEEKEREQVEAEKK